MDGGSHCSKSPEVLTVVDLGVGNLASLTSALRYLGVDFKISSDSAVICKAETLLLPGVGAFDSAVSRLDELGLREPITDRIAADVPTLGICLGMQLLFESSEEGKAEGLGIFPQRVLRLGRMASSRVPHVGFDSVHAEPGTWLHEALGDEPNYYFTHSFAVFEADSHVVLGRCDYDSGFVAAVESWPVVGVQFHPEKSQTSGLAFLTAFLLRSREQQ
jgi:glutamine amidotransferase